MSPYESDDLTEIVHRRGDSFIILQSSIQAEHAPEYLEIAAFSSLEEAEAYLRDG
jgi:hypothetical protein